MTLDKLSAFAEGFSNKPKKIHSMSKELIIDLKKEKEKQKQKCKVFNSIEDFKKEWERLTRKE